MNVIFQTNNGAFELCQSRLRRIDKLFDRFDSLMMQFQLMNVEHDTEVMSARVEINSFLSQRKFELIEELSKDDITMRELILEVRMFFNKINSDIFDNIDILELSDYVDERLTKFFNPEYVYRVTYDCVLYAAFTEIIRDHDGVNNIDTYIDCLQTAEDIGKTFKSSFERICGNT